MSNVQDIQLTKIDPNPWQPRIEEDHAHIKGLALSIAEHGLLQVPSARLVGDRVQLAFGHSRKAAYEFLHDASLQDPRWCSFPLNIVQLDDRQMANAAAQENVARKNISAIETARAIQRYVKDFGATQAEAGAMYGYASQSGVSNLLRLLTLPESVQQKVHAGVLPERRAREMIQLARVAPQAIEKVADHYVKCQDEDEKEEVMARGLNEVVHKQGVALRSAHFELAWPGKPLPAPDADGKKGEPSEIVACKGCQWHIESWGQDYCLRPACFNVKQRMFAQHDLERVAKKWGVAVATPEEAKKAAVVYNGQGHNEDEIKTILKGKHASLRVVLAGEEDYNGYDRERVLGSKLVSLVSINKPALLAATPKVKLARHMSTYDIERAKQKALTKRNSELITAAAPHLVAALGNLADELTSALWLAVVGGYVNDKSKAVQARGIAAMRVDLMSRMLEKQVAPQNDWKPKPARETEAAIVAFATLLKVRLHPGWQEPKQEVSAAKTKPTPNKKAR